MIVYGLLGAVVGVVLALTGAGGGILAVPLLIFGAHLGMAQAGPIGLLGVGLASLLGAVLGLRQGIVRYRAAALIATAGMLASPVGLSLAHRVPNQPLLVLFSMVLMWVAYHSFHQAKTPSAGPADAHLPCRINPSTGRFIWTWASARVFVAAGVITGLLSGLLGVGGGFVLVPVLRHYTGLSMQSIVATALAVVALVSGTGVLVSTAGGHFDWQIGMPFALGAIAGMLCGRWLGRFLHGAQLSRAFAGVAMLAAMLLLFKALG